MADNVVLNLSLPDSTIRKLRAVAMLSGKKIDDIEAEFVELVDHQLTRQIISSLGIVPEDLEERRSVRTSADATDDDTSTADSDLEDVISELAEDPNAHGLSGDDAEEEVLSVQEQVEKEVPPVPAQENEVPVAAATTDIQIPSHRVEDAGEDAEAFLEAAFATERRPERRDDHSNAGAARPARKAFSAQRDGGARVKVSEYTGDEGSDSPGWFGV